MAGSEWTRRAAGGGDGRDVKRQIVQGFVVRREGFSFCFEEMGAMECAEQKRDRF